MTRLFVAIATATTLLSFAPAHAQDDGGWYVGGGVGLTFGGNTRSDGIFTSTGSVFDGQRLGPAPGSTAEGKFDSSPTVRATLGYDVATGRFKKFRFEAELFNQEADTDQYAGELNGMDIDPVGTVNTTMSGVVLNVIYDIGNFSSVQPYIYAGQGFANVDTDYNFPGRGQVAISGSTSIIQAGLGVDIPFNDRTSFDVRYRFRRAGINEGGLDTDIDANTLQLGIRYNF